MIPRRRILHGLPAALLLLGARPAAALEQRSYRGALRYVVGTRENGRETFSVTVQPDGLRTLRAQCEMDDDRLLRDVTVTLDAAWRPVTAFVQLTIAGQFVGATWYRFSADAAEAEGYTRGEGRFSQRFALAQPADAFGTHPIHSDAWNLARLRLAGGREVATPRFSSSAQSNGASGPTLVRFPENYLAFAAAGRERVTVPAGRFDTEHFTMTVVPKRRVNHVWAFGEDCIPVRMTAEDRVYELTALAGDAK
jgi:hypothetical protein